MISKRKRSYSHASRAGNDGLGVQKVLTGREFNRSALTVFYLP